MDAAAPRVADEQAAKRVVLRLFNECMNGRRPELVPELFAPDFVNHEVGIHGAAQLEPWLRNYLSIFPDLKVGVLGMTAEAGRVWSWVKVSGTHSGPWHGVQATGKKVSWHAVAIDTVRDGRIAERHAVIDLRPPLREIGGTV